MDEVNELQASDKQRKMFFAMCSQLGLDSEIAKETVKNKYKLDSFMDISKDQMSEVIETLSKKTNEKVRAALVAFFKMNNPEAFKSGAIGFPDYTDYTDLVVTELLKYFYIREK